MLSPAFEELSLLFQLLYLTGLAGSSSKHLGLFWSSLDASLIPDADTANVAGSGAFVSVICSSLESLRTECPLDVLLGLLQGGLGDFLFLCFAVVLSVL